jgi:hypothetical protein
MAVKPTPTQPGDSGPHPAVPVIGSISPTTGPLPAVNLRVTGQNFTLDSVVVFDGVARPTTFTSPTDVQSMFNYTGVAGTYQVLVRDVAGSSNTQSFTFTGSRAADEQSPTEQSPTDEQARARRRR